MGTDTPLAVLSDRPQLLFRYFRQLFAQVTNPPIDPIREQVVMSLAMNIGPKANLLGEHAGQARRIRVKGPVLTNAQLEKIASIADPRFRSKTLRMLFPAAGGPAALGIAVESLCRQAAQAIREGHTLLVLSDRGVSADWAPIPSLLATAAVHNHLIREKLRTEAGLVVETGEAREVSHFALLLGYRDPATYRNGEGHALPAANRPGQGLHFNPWFANLNIAMPPPLTADGQVSYADGTNPTRAQMARDVSAFLAWTAEPRLENRRAAGMAVLAFLIFATILAYMAYQNIWHGGASRRVRATGPLDRQDWPAGTPAGTDSRSRCIASGHCGAARVRRSVRRSVPSICPPVSTSRRGSAHGSRGASPTVRRPRRATGRRAARRR
jgi:hypothetical protein